MTVEITVDMEAELNDAFVHYQSIRIGLGIELVDEFRKTIDGILAHPHAWQCLDETYRRCRLHRFPCGVIYRVDDARQIIYGVALMNLYRRPDCWRGRTKKTADPSEE